MSHLKPKWRNRSIQARAIEPRESRVFFRERLRDSGEFLGVPTAWKERWLRDQDTFDQIYRHRPFQPGDREGLHAMANAQLRFFRTFLEACEPGVAPQYVEFLALAMLGTLGQARSRYSMVTEGVRNAYARTGLALPQSVEERLHAVDQNQAEFLRRVEKMRRERTE